MKPADLRNATWREVQTHLSDDLHRVHAAWLEHGPGTTRQVSDRSGISLLTFRPRTTDLCDFGLVRLISRSGTEGVYAHVTAAEAEERWMAGERLPRESERAAAPEVNTVSLKDQILSQLSRLPIGEQLSIAGTIRARAAHTPRQSDPGSGAKQLDLLTA
jgi:hypothetical protein